MLSMNYYDRFFGAIYHHYLKAEKAAEGSVSFYFAFTTILGITLLEWTIVFSSALYLGERFFGSFQSAAFNVLLGVILFLINGLVFLPRKRYAELVDAYSASSTQDRRKASIHAGCILAFVVLFFAGGVIVTVLRW